MQNKTRKTSKVSDDFAKSCAGVLDGIASVGVLLLMTVFPLILHDSYFDILETKYWCYCAFALGTLGIMLLLALVMAFIDGKEYGGAHIKNCLSSLAPKNWRSTFTAADLAAIVFWLLCGVSTLMSDYLYEAFWGNEGRYSGFFLISIYVALYFAVSRRMRPREWPLWLFLASGMLVSLFGITDYFKMDIMGFCAELGRGQDTIFTSTMGNINTFTAYVGLVAGAAAGLFCAERHRRRKICWLVCMSVAFSAAVMGRSDNAYLSFAGVFCVLPFAVCHTVSGIRNYLAVLASFFSVLQADIWIARAMEGKVIDQGSLFQVIARIPGLWLLALLLWAAVFALYRQEKKRPELSRWTSSRPAFLWGIFLCAVLLAAVAVFYDANAAGHADRYGSIGKYFVFNDSWGTERGYIWRRSWDLFRMLPLRQRIFGYGPDTFSILTFKNIRAEMINFTGKTYDNAHNEYLQYLLTLGWAGLAAYVAFLALSIRQMAGNRGKDPIVIAALCAVTGYAVQALVNLNLPISAPMFWLLLTLGAGALRRMSGEEE